MHRAPGGDLQEPISLDLIQIPFQMNLALDLVEHALFGFAILTVPGVNPPVAKPHLNANRFTRSSGRSPWFLRLGRCSPSGVGLSLPILDTEIVIRVLPSPSNEEATLSGQVSSFLDGVFVAVLGVDQFTFREGVGFSSHAHRLSAFGSEIEFNSLSP